MKNNTVIKVTINKELEKIHNLYLTAVYKVELYKLGKVSEQEAIGAIFNRLVFLDKSEEYQLCKNLLSNFK